MNLRALLPGTAAAFACLAGGAVSPSLRADPLAKNPTSKFFVADINGEAQVDTGTEIDDLTKKSVYNATGTVIETKPKSNYAMVYSNGTGIYFDPLTKVEVNRFDQEPFRPNREDMDVEPSISQTKAFVDHGVVGLCTSKLVAGSNMTYSTPQGSVNIRGRKVVIAVESNTTVISMIEGESTVQAGAQDLGGHEIHDGEQAIITAGVNGSPGKIVIQNIPPDQKENLRDRVTAACIARKTVYFEVAARKTVGEPAAGAPASVFDATPVNAAATATGVGDQQVIVAVPVTPAPPATADVVSASFITTH